MQNRQDELEEFKRSINLTEYAASHGYVLNRKASSHNSATMADASGEKIIIARGTDEHWIYFSVHDESDHGSIIDFIQSRDGLNLGQVRKALRPWVGGTQRIKVPPQSYIPDMKPLPRDIAGVRSRYTAFDRITSTHPYLENTRGIPAAIIIDERFKPRIRIDGHKNAIFPHYNLDGICGFEIKNNDYTGFARGGAKGLWCSRPYHTPKSLVIAETAIDALSYAALHPADHANYVSVSGQLSPDQEELLRSAMAKMPAGSEIILAMDNDEGGTALIERIEGLFSAEDCPGVALRPHLPPSTGQDWNDALRASTAKVDPSAEIQPPEQ